MIRTNRFLLASLSAVLMIKGMIISGVRLGEAAADEPAKTPSETTTADADNPAAEAATTEVKIEFTFDKLIVMVDSFAMHEDQTLTIQKDGWHEFWITGPADGYGTRRARP